jgi:hypothetical protein
MNHIVYQSINESTPPCIMIGPSHHFPSLPTLTPLSMQPITAAPLSSEHNSSSLERERGYQKYSAMSYNQSVPLAGGMGLGLGVSTRYYPSYQPMTPPIRPMQPSSTIVPPLPLASLNARINSNRFDAFNGTSASNHSTPPRAEMGWFQKLALADSLNSPTVSSDTNHHHMNGFTNGFHNNQVSNINGFHSSSNMNGFNNHTNGFDHHNNHNHATMTTTPTRRRRSSDGSDVCAVDEADDDLQPMPSSSASAFL